MNQTKPVSFVERETNRTNPGPAPIEKAMGLPLIETHPRVDGDEVCCGHCTHLRTCGRAVVRPVAGKRHKGTLNIGVLYECELHLGKVFADNTCGSFERRRRAGA